ncbi:glucose 1-dehydrogenase [Marinovum sp. 2_MG-2023]|uniref:SDR family NAD(P)-dependent oxidoreductase n=1 Tax=unclassified Marinovum TaxID=2647166 RepID=UPI0026E46EBB|nr:MULTISPECIES: glucose 1-dehydrogenase [unclassified Marinovum]MDO6729861.1 glucose 1-dehydrogenase [Marinovum sp. 2_MG-2023]MDO6779675.1 glucose 1-dehydrogenase [Marinovum sp. 1_MG-2023]
MNRLDNKVAIITGGANGQGAVEAELFIEAGAKVVITDINTTAGEETAARLGNKCTFVRHDVTSEEDWAQVVKTTLDLHGQIDVLVNNAGIFKVLTLEDTDLKVWDQTVAINQTGVFLGMRAVAPAMKQRKSGSIVNISSIAGLTSAKAHAYCATKWAVRGMSKAAAVEFGPSNIRVNSVHPGFIDTPMLDGHGVPREQLVAKVPLGRTAEVIEVARVVLFVASDDSSYCTGHEFVVDGAIKA